MGAWQSKGETIESLENSIVELEAYARLHPNEADACNDTITKIKRKIKELDLQKVTGNLAKTLLKSDASRNEFYQDIDTINKNLELYSTLEVATAKQKSPGNKKVYIFE